MNDLVVRRLFMPEFVLVHILRGVNQDLLQLPVESYENY